MGESKEPSRNPDKDLGWDWGKPLKVRALSEICKFAVLLTEYVTQNAYSLEGKKRKAKMD